MDFRIARTVDKAFLAATTAAERQEQLFPSLERYWQDAPGHFIPLEGVKFTAPSSDTKWNVQFTVDQQNGVLTLTGATPRR
jgi:hypothetical protein